MIAWLTSFGNKKLQQLIKDNVTFETFFQKTSLNPNAHLITGMIWGYLIEEIENSLTQQVWYLDKLVDELAKGKKMEKILRQDSYISKLGIVFYPQLRIVGRIKDKLWAKRYGASYVKKGYIQFESNRNKTECLDIKAKAEQ